MTLNTISNSDDTIDSRDIIERIEELEGMLPQNASDVTPGTSEELQEMRKELFSLSSFMDQMKGQGGDEQWRGDWYPVTIIRDSYFTDYAKEMVLDCDLHSTELPHYIEIDWEATARNIRQDYTSIDFDGVTYWVR